jgi:DNA-binding NtrC family response regulator
MPTESESARPDPSVILAIGDPELQERLAALLADADLKLRPCTGSSQELLERAASGEATILVIEGHQLHTDRSRQALAGISTRTGAPAVVVVTDDEDAVARAEILATGAAGIVEAEPELPEVLESVGRAHEERGLTEPDRGPSTGEPRIADFRSRSPHMHAFLDLVERIKGSHSSLLICGETGVGKEHLARAIHSESPRSAKPFVSVNCAAIPEHLIESELFGHVEGAFTGATRDHAGRFRHADGGTIFLDEIGDLPAPLQARLLMVLQRHEVQPVGSDLVIPVDVRVMAATNQDLASAVEAGRFREDLYYRLNVIPLEIPPLRERAEDIPELTGMFMRHCAEMHGRREVRSITQDAMGVLLGHDWPGNVRQLLNVIERAVLLCRGDTITAADLALSETATDPARAEPGQPSIPAAWYDLPFADAKLRVVEGFERSYLERLLRETGGVIGESARRAGISERTLYEKMKRLDLQKEDYAGETVSG